MSYYKYEEERNLAEDRVAELEEERVLLLAIKEARLENEQLPVKNCSCDTCVALRAHDAWLVERAKEGCPGCFPGKPCWQHKDRPRDKNLLDSWFDRHVELECGEPAAQVGTATLPGYSLPVKAPAEPVSHTQQRLLYVKPYPAWARGDKVSIGGLGKRWDGPYIVMGIRDGELQLRMLGEGEGL